MTSPPPALAVARRSSASSLIFLIDKIDKIQRRIEKLQDSQGGSQQNLEDLSSMADGAPGGSWWPSLLAFRCTRSHGEVGENKEEEEDNLFEGLIGTDDYRDCRNFAEANGRCCCSRRRSSGRNSAT